MRPSILYPLFASVSSLSGVGPAMQSNLRRLLRFKPIIDKDQQALREPVLRDVLFHMPGGYTDRRNVVALNDVLDQTVATCRVRVGKHTPSVFRKGGKKTPYRIAIADDSGSALLTYFNSKGDYLSRTLPEGQERIISGRAEIYDGVLQFQHPDIVMPVEKSAEALRLQANYPLTQGVSQKQVEKLVRQSLDKLPVLPEWSDTHLLKQKQWLAWDESIKRIHLPQSDADVSAASNLRMRLSYDELLAHQLALAFVRDHTKQGKGIVIPDSSALRQQLIDALPFTLTQGQVDVLAEIDADMQSGQRMLRLLQGDVGSGKTLVALAAMLPVIEMGYQGALMVPTDLLARQHVESLRPFMDTLGLKIGFLSGKLSTAERAEVLSQIETGEVHLVVGTHALFQQSVSFGKLGMVVIDEQHRFGVNQRLSLSDKGQNPHILLMTATPIPRSLSMTAYGDMDCSLLKDKPAGRQPIETRTVSLDRLHEVVDGLKRAIAGGAKVYWICPLVDVPEEEADTHQQLTSVTERYHLFKNIFGDRVGMAHGQMPLDEREQNMQGFAGDAYDLLVATTVVEVGVNVPEATIMVIEHAERFGLSQLHQLRGRVGRGEKPSSCVLLYAPRIGEVSKKRLQVMRDSNDGFFISEEDLVLRGAGDTLGTRQSGFPDYLFADPIEHKELLLAARDDAKLILNKDPSLHSERGEALRVLLYLFEYDASLRYLDAG
ncbi:MAG: ATP-dependent DNA helicase RecG [Rickettsiales bacterium]|nr:ATP-dependent DNA helicase RecG [Rickettsiales bacterium]